MGTNIVGGDASKNPTCEAVRGADFACVSQSRRWKNCSRRTACPRPGNFGVMDGDGDGWIWVMGAKVSQKRVPQTKLNSCSFDPLAAWNACSAMHPPKLGRPLLWCSPASHVSNGWLFFLCGSSGAQTCPAGLRHAMLELSQRHVRASNNSQWTQASKYPRQRSYTNSGALFELFFDYLSTSADTNNNNNNNNKQQQQQQQHIKNHSKKLTFQRSLGSKMIESPFLMSFRCRVTSTPPTRVVSTSSIRATSLM